MSCSRPWIWTFIGSTIVADWSGKNKKEARYNSVTSAMIILVPKVLQDFKELEAKNQVLAPLVEKKIAYQASPS